ncbi:MAG: hypothetical protein KUG77_07180 [Nannocystaceae bacterium]|nr:hypothetical protein [Nannocystaceae bacterium]
MTTIDPTKLEHSVVNVKDILAIKDAAELEILSRAIEAEAHVLEARLTHTKELGNLAAQRAKGLTP